VVIPRTAVGFLQNPFKYIVLSDFGMVEYKNNPESPAKFIKALPARLYLPTISTAVSR